MLSIKGIYENGEIKILEHIPKKGKFEVIITFLESQQNSVNQKQNLEGLLSDLNNDNFKDFIDYAVQRNQDWFTGRKTDI